MAKQKWLNDEQVAKKLPAKLRDGWFECVDGARYDDIAVKMANEWLTENGATIRVAECKLNNDDDDEDVMWLLAE